MSVEEAQGAVIRAFIGQSGAFHVYLDRLILEVRAEQPCYRVWWDDSPLQACTKEWAHDPQRFCPSCEARSHLIKAPA